VRTATERIERHPRRVRRFHGTVWVVTLGLLILLASGPTDASRLIPLLILWVGIDYEARVAVIFIGTFFQQMILIADVAAHVSRDLLDVSYTLGADRGQVVYRVLIPATLPGVMDTLRITMGWAWTYLVVAELVAANRGLGYMILNSMRGLFTDRIFVGIMVIGLLGLLTDQGFKYLHRWLLPWSPKAG